MCFFIYVSNPSKTRKSLQASCARSRVAQWTRAAVRTLCCAVTQGVKDADDETDTRSRAAIDDVPADCETTTGRAAAHCEVAVDNSGVLSRECRSDSPGAACGTPVSEKKAMADPDVLALKDPRVLCFPAGPHVLPKDYIYNCTPPTGYPHPDPDDGFYHRLIMCAPTIVGIRLVATYGTEVKVRPKRLAELSLDSCIRSLHPQFSIDEIANFIERERRARIRHRPRTPCAPWLHEIGRAAETLGFSERLLADELLACARRDRETFAPDGISSLIEQQSWTNLARRICVDKAMLRFAFHAPGEANTRRMYSAFLRQLEGRYFKYIFERAPGEFIDCISKDECIDEPPPAESSATPPDDEKMDAAKGEPHDGSGDEGSEESSDDSGDDSDEGDESESDGSRSDA